MQPMHEQDVFSICMDSTTTTTSSSTTMQQAMLNHFNPFLPLHHHDNTYLDINGAAASAGLCNLSAAQVGLLGGGGGGGVVGGLGDYGLVENYAAMGLESDLFLPALEGRPALERNINVSKECLVHNNHNLNYSQSIKGDDFVGIGNHWNGESLRVGELDWEGLLANVSSLPYLDS